MTPDQFARLLGSATLGELESWLADLQDPDSGAFKLPDWKKIEIYRAYSRLTGARHPSLDLYE